MTTDGTRPGSTTIDPTAIAVAVGLVLASQDPELAPLLPDEHVALAGGVLATASRSSARLGRAAGTRAGRAALTALMHRLNPGIVPHYVARKAFLAETAAAAIANGTDQVLLLGAGFDALGPRLARRNGAVRVVEVDRAPVLAHKRTVLQRTGGMPVNLAGVTLDLGAPDWAPTLLAHHLISSDRPLLVIIEGVTMYLAPEAVDRLFTAIGTLSTRPQIAFTVLDMSLDDPASSGRARRWLAKRGSPLQWTLARGALPAWLAGHGYAVEMVLTACELGGRAGFSPRLQDALARQTECVCVASRLAPG